MSNHSPNCVCNSCTGGDPRLTKIRSRYGANSYNNVMRFAARPGVYGSNHAETAVKTISNPAPPATVAPTSGNNTAQTVMQLALQALGTIMDNQKNGVQQPPVLDKIGQVGNQVANAGVNAGIQQANTTVGENVIKFSPYIIGALVLIGGGMIFLIAKKS